MGGSGFDHSLERHSTCPGTTMSRFLARIGISIVIGWMIGVQAAFAFGPEGNLAPMLYIFVTVPLTYAGSFLIVPLLSGWLDRLR
jgi:ABC-type anion transport system duplicated permease subunit